MIGRDTLRPLLYDHSKTQPQILKSVVYLLLLIACPLGLFAWTNFFSKPNHSAGIELSVAGLQYWQSVDPNCKCVGGSTYGQECTRVDHTTEWCYVDPINNKCQHVEPSTKIPGNVWSVDPCKQADLCGHNCYDAMMTFGIDVCHVTWKVGCHDTPPPPPVTLDTRVTDLCPHTCREELAILDNVQVKFPGGALVPREKIRVNLKTPNSEPEKPSEYLNTESK